MGPIEQKPLISMPLKTQPKYNLESLPTTLKKLITSFLPPNQALTASPASKMVYKMLQDNTIWQTVARNLNITLEDPKNAKASLTKLFRSVNQLTLSYLPSDKAKELSSIPDPFEQNKTIEKHLNFERFQKLIGNLVQKRDLNQTEIETVKMFVRSGVLDKVLLSDIKDVLRSLAALPEEMQHADTFSQPEIIKIILGKLKEIGVAVETFSDLLGTIFNFSSGFLDNRYKECIVAFLEGGATIMPDTVGGCFQFLLVLTEDQWDIFELFLKNAPRKALNELKETFKLMPELPDVDLPANAKKLFGIEKALYGHILSRSKERELKYEGIPPHERDTKVFRETIHTLNLLNDVRQNIFQSNSLEEIIKILSDKFSFIPKSIITQIVNSHCNLEANKKSVAATYARVKEYISKQN